MSTLSYHTEPENRMGSVELKNFIDLFAGIGGFRIALESFGLKCLWSCEWDKHAQDTYFNNFGEIPQGDITKIDERNIPPHDILCAGFPCQAFSISGKQKGFEDTRGTLFFNIVKIIKYHKPKVVLLENVKNFGLHNKGKTLKTVLRILDELGYHVFYKLLNASFYGVPTSRERIFFVCFNKKLGIPNFQFPEPTYEKIFLKDVLEPDIDESEYIIKRKDIRIYKTPEQTPELAPIQIGIINNGGQGERIYSINGHAITLSAHGGGAAAKTGAYSVKGIIRKLTPKECSRVMGFPDNYIIPKSKAQAYKQFGNSVVVTVVKKIVEQILKACKVEKEMNENELSDLGSMTAKDGFRNEDDVVEKFNNWKKDCDAKKWLEIMGYDLKEIKKVIAVKLHGYKTDVQVQITIILKKAISAENLSVKLVSNPRGYNQVDKRWIDHYKDLWNIPNDVTKLLKLYTGEIKPSKKNLRDPRRMFFDEMQPKQKDKVLSFFKKQKILVISDILKGRGKFSAGWMLVALRTDGGTKWVLKTINEVMNTFGNGEVRITDRGSMRIGQITMQRKGGDAGRDTSTMLQFKINPVELFDQ